MKYAEDSRGYDQDYLQQMRLAGYASVAGKMAELGFVADAVAAYGEALAIDREISPTARRMINNRGRGRAPMPRGDQPDARRDQGRRAQGDARSSPRRRQGRREAGREARRNRRRRRAAGPRKTGKAEAAVDLMVLIHPRLLDKARIRSLLAESIGVPGKGAMPPERAEQLAATARCARGPAQGAPRRPLGRDRGGPGRAGAARSGADRLRRSTGLSPWSTGPRWRPCPRAARANSRQRAAAARQVPLWLVARAAGERQPGSERIRPRPDRSEARAIEAARRQADNTAMMAMLREQGEQSLDARRPPRRPRPSGPGCSRP